MTTATPNKTDSVVVLAHQAAVHPITIVGSAVSCLTKRAALVFLYHGYVEAAADTNPGKFKVQTRPDVGSGTVNEHWVTVAEFLAKGTTPDTEALTATEAAAVTSLAVASTTGIVAEDLLYIQDTTTLAASEWAECQEVVTNTSVEIVDGLTTGKDNADVIWNDSSTFIFALDLQSSESFRVLWSHEGAAGANGNVKALAITYDSDNIV